MKKALDNEMSTESAEPVQDSTGETGSSSLDISRINSSLLPKNKEEMSAGQTKKASEGKSSEGGNSTFSCKIDANKAKRVKDYENIVSPFANYSMMEAQKYSRGVKNMAEDVLSKKSDSEKASNKTSTIDLGKIRETPETEKTRLSNINESLGVIKVVKKPNLSTGSCAVEGKLEIKPMTKRIARNDSVRYRDSKSDDWNNLRFRKADSFGEIRGFSGKQSNSSISSHKIECEEGAECLLEGLFKEFKAIVNEILREIRQSKIENDFVLEKYMSNGRDAQIDKIKEGNVVELEKVTDSGRIFTEG
ncbi:hypothetical protein AX774_g7500 [Zancudomyces culisetae]|uniref:Uncharacterized protein n=1 Tax=Zancudomyces culisetae TaxID=1213189 RepID=A0A1R1PDN4_ZANCU|nr:hypothetical protein AX774_g7500 [Zancudomyces culisetae]|eukprot:OMH79094.1 hypothetical protein AX774_g7500 [Zancudomyces culisetae]